MRTTGYYEALGNLSSFIPYPLPPANPQFIMDSAMVGLYGEAMLHLGKLNEMAHKLPDPQRFIKAYVIKEALLSSSIEGIHTTLLDVFTQTLMQNSKPNKDTQLVMNYTKALYKAFDMMHDLPLVSRVILAAHKQLMEIGEGDKSDPGNYRKQAVRVGNLIPASPVHVAQLMSHLEQFINTDTTIPPLIKAGLAHVQFETIHPFLDGNGRIGRLLIVLILVQSKLLTEPIIYPSYYFKQHQLEYYQALDKVRSDGDFESWITFYLGVIRDSSVDAYKRAKEIEALEHDLAQRITNEQQSTKMREIRLKALTAIFSYPVIGIGELSMQLEVTYNTAKKIIDDFLKLGFLVEENKQKRGKLFRFKPYLEILER